MNNLLYYHTEPFDIIYDPFTGGGTTIDSCKFMFRKYFCSDIKPVGHRKDDIMQWDITNGFPDDLQKPDMIFLDPPYWKQAQNKYSDDENDLSNMSLSEYYKSMESLFDETIRKNIKKIAIVIAPTQYSNKNHKFEDHIFKFNEILSDKYSIEMRYTLPYSTEQYNGNQVDIMKKEKKCLALNRNLVVWERK